MTQRGVLERGLNFSDRPAKLPKDEIIAGVEAKVKLIGQRAASFEVLKKERGHYGFTSGQGHMVRCFNGRYGHSGVQRESHATPEKASFQGNKVGSNSP